MGASRCFYRNRRGWAVGMRGRLVITPWRGQSFGMYSFERDEVGQLEQGSVVSGGTSAVAYTSITCVVFVIVLRQMKPCRWLSARARCICVLKHLDRKAGRANMGFSCCSNLEPRCIVFSLLEATGSWRETCARYSA